MLNWLYLRILLAVLFTGYLAWEDYKTSFMNNWVLFAMLISAIIIDLLSLDETVISYSIVGSVMIFALCIYLVEHGDIGFGDLWLLIGVFLFFPQSPMPSSIPFFFSVVIVSVIFCLVGTAVHYARKINWGKLKPELKKEHLALVIASVLPFIVFNINVVTGCLFALVVVSIWFLAVFDTQIKREAIVKMTRIKEILDCDILFTELMDKGLVAKYGIQKVMTKSEIKKLKFLERKEDVHEFPIARDLPRFGPYVFIGLVLCLILGSALVW